MINTMQELFDSTVQHDELLQWAREMGALQRLREIHPADMCLALTNCAMGDETRSIATARRAFFTLTGYMHEESSFYKRFNEGLVVLMKRLFERAVAAGSFEQRQVLSAVLEGTGIIDIEAILSRQGNAPGPAPAEGWVRIIHPFHPLRGKELPFVDVRCNRWGDRVWFQADDGSAHSMPRQWTSLHAPDAFEIASAGRAWFRPNDLVKLAELISSIRDEGGYESEEAKNVYGVLCLNSKAHYVQCQMVDFHFFRHGAA